MLLQKGVLSCHGRHAWTQFEYIELLPKFHQTPILSEIKKKPNTTASRGADQWCPSHPLFLEEICQQSQKPEFHIMGDRLNVRHNFRILIGGKKCSNCFSSSFSFRFHLIDMITICSRSALLGLEVFGIVQLDLDGNFWFISVLIAPDWSRLFLIAPNLS